MTITQAFIQWLEAQGVATFGQDLYLRRVPDSKKTPSSIYWVIPNGGFPLGKNKTGEMLKLYTFVVNFRSTSAREVEEKLFALEELVNCENCLQLDGFEVVDVEASIFPSDSDIDDEDRETGFIQVNIQTYKQRC